MAQGISMKLIPALMLVAFSGAASASGFQLQNQSGSGNGNAFAGAAAAAEDASTIFFNPAGMTNLQQGHNISLSGTLINRSINFTNQGSTTTIPGVFPLPTGNGGNAGGLSFLPAGYWAYGISPSLSVGVGVGPTFGNTTEYASDFVGRNAGIYFSMEQININPSVAYKVSEKISLGAGINFAHNESHFKQGVPTSLTNYLDVKGDDWAVGYNLGATFQVSPSTRIGLAYRSRLDFELEGKQEYATPSATLINQDVKASLTTPANFSMAVSQKLSDKWEMLGDVTWTEWSVVQSLYVDNKQTGAPLQRLPYNFKDTWRVGLGANYQYDDAWKLRFGVAHDKSPVKSAEDRTMTLPDSDRTWLSFGAKYALSKAASLDFGYTHIFFVKTNTNRDVTTGYPGVTTVRQTIRGDVDTSVDILSVQYNQAF
ncbi:OmpP1/FadL family transporter [Propionivibrio sp.]|uniref:OmpP1/FadL family transporter n=1 Tax=Propionivibrio sp. TaxID=2212460 RepID=UPI003BEF5877